MWGLRRSRRVAAAPVDDRRRALLMRAIQDLAGTTNGVVYDVPRGERPEPRRGFFFFRGSDAWRSYLVARRQVDTGDPAVIVSLRVLDDEERHIVADWGTTYANCLLIIEPSDSACDLTEPLNPARARVDEALAATLALVPGDDLLPSGWTGGTPLGAALRSYFGTWVYWSAPPPAGEVRRVPLHLNHREDTLWSRLRTQLGEHFPQAAFDEALGALLAHERELFGGPVPRARSAFRTRLGLPVLRDVHCADRALRRLVNEGRVTVVGPSFPGRPAFGPGRPVPDDLPDEEFARFVMR